MLRRARRARASSPAAALPAPAMLPAAVRRWLHRPKVRGWSSWVGGRFQERQVPESRSRHGVGSFCLPPVAELGPGSSPWAVFLPRAQPAAPPGSFSVRGSASTFGKKPKHRLRSGSDFAGAGSLCARALKRGFPSLRRLGSSGVRGGLGGLSDRVPLSPLFRGPLGEGRTAAVGFRNLRRGSPLAQQRLVFEYAVGLSPWLWNC